MLEITDQIRIPFAEFDWVYARSGGPGGQNVNKVASKAQLRWNLVASASVPEPVKVRLTTLHPTRLTASGEFLVVSQKYRDQERNRLDCLEKLIEMIRQATRIPTVRRATRPTKASQRRRLDDKKQNAKRKAARRGPPQD